MGLINKMVEKIYLNQKGNIAYTDSLTGVSNRAYYDNVVCKKYDKEKVYITYVDVNNLKKVNDKFGHAQGDRLIIDVANYLQSLQAAKEICRIGGDEFIVVSNIGILPKYRQASFGVYKKKAMESVPMAVGMADSICQREKRASKISFKIDKENW